MTIRDELVELLRQGGDAPATSSYTFLRDHGVALVEALENDAKWRMCNGTHRMDDETEIRCHVTVGVNSWDGDEWQGFTTCNPGELKCILDEMDAARGES